MSDMSCQQVPSSNISDDPYIFTETPITTTVYTSQLGRITPIKSNQQQQQLLPTNSSYQTSQRLNGIQIINGCHNTSTIYSKTTTSASIKSHQTSDNNKLLIKHKTLPPPSSSSSTTINLSPIVQNQQILSQNYLKPPPPLYHNIQNTLVNHSTLGVVGGNSGGIVHRSSSIQLTQQPIATTTTSTATTITSTTVSSKKIAIGGQKIINLNENRLQSTNKIKCEQYIKQSGDITTTTATNAWNQNGTNLPKFTVPKKTGSKKLPIETTRFIKRSASQTSQTENHRASISSRLSNVSSSANFNTYIQPPKLIKEWHAPGSYVYDYTGPGSTRIETFELAGCTQNVWFPTTLDTTDILNREQRLEIKRANLRRQAFQQLHSQKLRTNLGAKRRLICISKAIVKTTIKEEPSSNQKCCISNCSNDSLALTAYCYLHITHNTDQMLFHACTAKFSDNSQCRVPVFDISHELPLCREHAWKRDNYDRILQEQKPKKPPRKKPKPSAMTRPPKRNKKKKKPPIKQIISQNHHHHHHYNLNQNQNIKTPVTTVVASTNISQQNKILINNQKYSKEIGVNDNNHHHHQNQQYQHHQHQHQQHEENQHQENQHIELRFPTIKTIQPSSVTLAPIQNHQRILMIPGNTQEFLNVCENSSAYESSEDTGVGGLSETELITHDVIEEIPLGDTKLLEEHDLTNVLNQIPEDAFDDFFGGQQNSPFEPTQEEQEDLQRALEAVDEQVKNLQQLSDSNFLTDLLDVDDQMLDDADMCNDVVIQTTNGTSEIRGGLVHT